MYRFSDFRNHNRRTIVIAGEALSISVCHQSLGPAYLIISQTFSSIKHQKLYLTL